jgi:hypothetical protein
MTNNLYEKLNNAKADLYKNGLNKGGRNEFSKYDYFELPDFLPEILACEIKYKFCCLISFASDLATLTIIDNENPIQTIVVTSPMSTAALKGMHEVQNLGAVQTYLRRYLYMAAFEIVEHDAIDSGEKSTPQSNKVPEPAKVYDATAKLEAKQPNNPPPTDLSGIFLTGVQYRVNKAESKTSAKSGKQYTKILINENNYALEVSDFDHHPLQEGDYIVIKKMKPIESREYQGKTYYSTTATISLYEPIPPVDNSDLPFEL